MLPKIKHTQRQPHWRVAGYFREAHVTWVRCVQVSERVVVRSEVFGEPGTGL